MTTKKSTIIIALQALLIVILFWMLIFYSKDEYEEFREEQEEEIESLDRVSEEEGISIISLSPAVQKNSGVTTAKVDAFAYQGEIKSFGTVVPIDALIEAKARFLSLKAVVNTAHAASSQNLAQYQRLKVLNADNKNVSDLAVQQALGLVNADKANISTNALQIKNLQTSIRLKWGESLAALALNNQLSARFNDLLSRKKVLVQISLPMSASNPHKDDTIMVSPLSGDVDPISATYVSAATQTDRNGVGKTFYYSAPSEFLRIGMRVSAEVASTNDDTIHGIVIPSNAVVWYAGKPWAYFKQGEEQFVRQPISAETEIDSGWFNQGLSTDSEVVVSGAQLLLSEEFKYLIKNENDD